MSGAASTLGEAPEPLYTQCSKCETVFKLSAEVLRAAGGQVRCGKCGELFNALARLAEESTAFPSDESPLELEARADSILESSESLQVVRAVAKDEEVVYPPGVEGAQLEFVDPDRALEFTLPPGELDRIFIETKKRVLPLPRAPKAPADGEVEEVELDLDPGPAKPELDDHESVQPESVEPEAVVEQPPAMPDRRRQRGGGGGLEIPEEIRREMLAGIEDELDPVSAVRNLGRSRAPRGAFYTWLGAAIAAALLLLGQILHHNPDWPIARAMHGMLGAPQASPANLSAYQLRQWGVTGDPDANGTLKVRASILNSAAQLQPYPLLRVTLADRFGKKIGTRDFEPAEYLGKPTARLLAPGERVDATLQILDPGKNAEGFEIDVCLRGADQKISCAADVAPQR
jgi:predicted Zn finger-like uncharacterized protein